VTACHVAQPCRAGSRDKRPFYPAHDVDEMPIVDLAKRAVDWLALRNGECRPIERSGLIDLARTS
jgi:hypothetical protein